MVGWTMRALKHWALRALMRLFDAYYKLRSRRQRAAIAEGRVTAP